MKRRREEGSASSDPDDDNGHRKSSRPEISQQAGSSHSSDSLTFATEATHGSAEDQNQSSSGSEFVPETVSPVLSPARNSSGSSDNEDAASDITSDVGSEDSWTSLSDDEYSPSRGAVPEDSDDDSDTGNWEGPPRYLERLKRLQARRSRQRNFQRLQVLCLRAISDHLNYFLYRDEPFSCLPGSLLDSVVWQLEADGRLNNPCVLPLLVSPRSRSLPMNLQQAGSHPQDLSHIFSTADFTNLFERISRCCGENLRCLRMRLNFPDFLQKSERGWPKLEDLHHVLRRLQSLEELALNLQGEVNDQTMEVIASSCHRLRSLDVSDNPGVTDAGMRWLCGQVQSSSAAAATPAEAARTDEVTEAPGCLELEVLNVTYTHVTKRGLACALAQLPCLLTLRHEDIHKGIHRFAKEQGTTGRSALQELCPTARLQRYLDTICTAMPHVKTLDLATPTKTAPLLNLEEVHELKVSCRISSERLMGVVNHFCSKLTRLEIVDYKEALDVSEIGYLCKNLEVFHFCDNASPKQDCAYQLNEREHFTKLRSFELKIKDPYNLRFRPSAFPVQVLRCALSSSRLESVSLKEMMLPEGLLESLAAEAQAHEEVFSNLECLFLHACLLPIEKLDDVICAAPRLRKITMLRCSDPNHVWVSEHKTLDSFIKRNKLPIAVFRS